jgi:H+-transporting ATPase
LLFVNAVIGFAHEHRAQDAIEALRSRLRPSTRVFRDGVWITLDARELVPNDIVHVRMGDVAPADLEIQEGTVSVDESVLTGESLPIERTAGASLFSASTVKRGEAAATCSSNSSANGAAFSLGESRARA